eukprot:4204620-Prymnesium_polylepis.1
MVTTVPGANSPRQDHSKGRLGGDKLDVVVEVGANIGACTLQLLLHTNATVLAFEPSPLNLFHLTESLHRTALGNPSFSVCAWQGVVCVYT